ncbi:DUF3800 domain-containing protein [Salinicola sp. JS01]|uniref:DUF3800 domain-containing protein n=1 Tax=Salinicola sp. JS01 TaxID=3050071 RepID=UPI00255BE31F|nr:DUF3800 domain-containing protein [Salinicola sp. JS01]WIX32645.1 DUF3800 domain-containing protein [Salinicola sp. JS01]
MDVEGNDMEDEPVMPETGRNRGFSDFVVYVDESGDHGMLNIDANYPVFVLAFCIRYRKASSHQP